MVGVVVGTFEAIGIKPGDVETVIVPSGRVVVAFVETVLVTSTVTESVFCSKA